MKDTRQLLFVCGFPGGGTDLLKTVLNAHPKVHITGELPFLPKVSNDSLQVREGYKMFTRDLIKHDVFNNLKFTLRQEQPEKICKDKPLNDLLYDLLPGNNSQIKGSKTPQFTEHLKELKKVYPNAYFIMVTRDVRDVCVSWHVKWRKDMLLCAHKWQKRMTQGYRSAQNNNILIIKYEDLILYTPRVIGVICDYLDINISTYMMEHHRFTKSIQGKTQYGQKIDPTNFGKWRQLLNEKKVNRIEQISYNTMKDLRYTPYIACEEIRLTSSEKMLGAIRDFYSVVFFGNRNLKGTYKVRGIIKSISIECKKIILRML